VGDAWAGHRCGVLAPSTQCTAAICAQYHAQGAQAFKNADYKSALAAYSEALRWLCPGSQAQLGSSTPVSSSNQEEASRLHSNRAQCLIKLNRPQEAVTEGDCAVRADPKSHKVTFVMWICMAIYAGAVAARSCGFCKPMLWVLPLVDELPVLSLQQPVGCCTPPQALYRRASAFKLAGNKSAAQQDCQSGLDLVKDLQGAAATEAASALQSLLQELGSAPDSLPASAPSQRQQKLLLQHQPQAPLLTEEVDTTWGRHMRAASALAPGTDVLTEQAAAFVLYREAQASRCWGCGAELQGDPPVPYFCPCCPLPVYCSPECQRSDAHHVPGGPECGLAWPRLLPEEGLLALRLARLEHQLLHRQQQEQGQRQGKGSMQPHTPTGAAQSLAGEVQAPPGDGKHSPVPGAASKQLLALQQLSSHEDQHRVEQRIAWAVLAVVAADLFQAAVEVAAARQPSHVAPQPRQEPQPLVEPYSILQWLYRSATNSFALTALLAPSFRLGLSKQVRLWGRGVFPQAAAFNHSCTPNVSVRFKGTMLTARATGPLQPGQQAFISYGGYP
jgi:tetratricopeptide (TPR) repeat protein